MVSYADKKVKLLGMNASEFRVGIQTNGVVF